jgi:hypothetical protein
MNPQVRNYDVVIYAATPGGVCAAMAAARERASVLLLEPRQHVGGLNTSGLNNNEQHHMFPAETYGGICRTFFDRLKEYYPDTWGTRPGWFNSRHFEAEMLRLLDRPGITVRFDSWLQSAQISSGRITGLTLEDGSHARARMFIDASYEGDLLAAAGVSSHLGREARSELEPLAGVRWTDPVVPVRPRDHHGLIPGLSHDPLPKEGAASAQVQVVNFRVTLTNRRSNLVPIPKPAGYDPRDHELLARTLEAGAIVELRKILGLYPLPNDKFECNNNQAAVVSLARRGIATEWPTATRSGRQAIWHRLREYNLGLMHFLATDPRVPEPLREQMQTLGLAADEYADNGHWPYELYVREARRLQGAYTMTHRDICDDRRKDDAICLGSHYIDCHWVDRYPVGDEGFRNEGRIWQKGRVFEIPYRAMLPQASECTNLLVPVCVSASHVAFCATRVEPTWMKTGEAAGVASCMALEKDIAVQEVDTNALAKRLESHGQIVRMTAAMESL